MRQAIVAPPIREPWPVTVGGPPYKLPVPGNGSAQPSETAPLFGRARTQVAANGDSTASRAWPILD